MKYGEMSTNKSPEETRRDLHQTFERMTVEDWGTPRPKGDIGKVSGGATVWFVLNGRRIELSCTRFPQYRQNLRSVWSFIESARLAWERGIIGDFQQFFVSLPPPPERERASGSEPRAEPEPEPDRNPPPHHGGPHDPYVVLGVGRHAPMTEIERRYRELSLRLHPDTPGGSTEAMRRLNVAIAAIRRERRSAGATAGRA